MPLRETLDSLDAELTTVKINEQYHAFLEERWTRIDWCQKLLSFILASGAFAAVATSQDFRTVAALAAAVGAAVALVLRPAELALKHSKLRQRFIDLRPSLASFIEQCRRLPSPENEAEVLAELQGFREARATIERDQPPANRKLLLKAQAVVSHAEGRELSLAQQKLLK